MKRQPEGERRPRATFPVAPPAWLPPIRIVDRAVTTQRPLRPIPGEAEPVLYGVFSYGPELALPDGPICLRDTTTWEWYEPTKLMPYTNNQDGTV